jgi:LmbE family N-acetylglucosaminyl deacetylase
MQIETLDQLGNTYEHVYISPHLDDTPLSGGGALAAQLAAGQRVLSITLCTAAPDPARPLSALAEEFHSQWQLTAAQAVSARLAEEREAMARLPGLDYWWAGRIDAIYRFPEAYNTRESLFNTPDPRDPQFADLAELFSALRQRMPQATFYGPMGIGLHVDHLIAHTSLRSVFGNAVRFYEDLPYVAWPDTFDIRMAQLADAPRSAHAIAIDATLTQKIHAIHAYASQLYELFGGAEAMEQQIAGYAASVAPTGAHYGERVWQLG